MRMNFRRGDAKRLVEFGAKLTRCFVEHRDSLRRPDCHAFRAFSQLGRRDENSFLQIDRRFALHVVRMSRHETNSVSHTDPHWPRSMDGFALRTLAASRNLWGHNPRVMVAIGNPVSVFTTK